MIVATGSPRRGRGVSIWVRRPSNSSPFLHCDAFLASAEHFAGVALIRGYAVDPV
jgi:hypothetical protein